MFCCCPWLLQEETLRPSLLQPLPTRLVNDVWATRIWEDEDGRARYKADWLNGRMRVFLDPADDVIDVVVALQLFIAAAAIRCCSHSICCCCLMAAASRNGLWRINGLFSVIVIVDPPKRGCWWSNLMWDSTSNGLPLLLIRNEAVEVVSFL